MDADKAALADIKTVEIDISRPIEERLQRYIEQIGDPYTFLCGKTPVRISFADSGRTLDEAVKDHYTGLKSFGGI